MPKYRQIRINEEMRRETSEIIRTVKDPRINTSFITITRAECSPDLKFAKIYFSAVTKDDKETESEEIKKGFVSAAGYIRSKLAERLNLRITPEIKFIADDSLERGAEIFKLMKQVENELHAAEDDDDGE